MIITDEQKSIIINNKRLLFNNLYSFLNSEQKEAVFNTEGPLLILAGAGSGKTTVLVNRLAFILKYGNAYHSNNIPANIPDNVVLKLLNPNKNELLKNNYDVLDYFSNNAPKPENVLAITFTNKAANEIKSRISSLFSDNDIYKNVYTGTFHSICLRILYKWQDSIGYEHNFGICDADDSKKIINECIKELKLDTKNVSAKYILNCISNAKDQLLSPSDYKTIKNEYNDFLPTIYMMYQKKLLSSNLMDFDDIIFNTVSLLRNNDNARDSVQKQFKYVLVDEYQDTSKAQFELISIISNTYKNIMVVGDDDQSIYKFRGATIENILNFDKIFKNTKIIKLEQNYRSTKNILNAANCVISKNSGRRKKELWTNNSIGDNISIVSVSNQISEAKFICDKIDESVSNNNFKYKDFAILYRTNSQSRSIEQAFAKSGTPYKILGSIRFFDRKEIKDILAYLSVINNPDDNLRIKRIINLPKRGIGSNTIELLSDISNKNNVSIYHILLHPNLILSLSNNIHNSISDFTTLISKLKNSSELSISNTIKLIAEKIGYLNISNKNDFLEKERIENIGELISTAKQYELSVESPNLNDFLTEIALVSDVDKYDNNSDTVTLMTIHSSKGLEFPCVFLPGMEEGIFPSYQSIQNPSELEEERRLAYVAITRAKEKLYLIYTHERLLNGSTMYNLTSRFINDIPDSLINKINFENNFHDNYSLKETKINSFNNHNEYHQIKPKKFISDIVKNNFQIFNVDDLVYHTSFGKGKILSSKDLGGDIIYEIDFEKVGKKKLMATYARLSKYSIGEDKNE